MLVYRQRDSWNERYGMGKETLARIFDPFYSTKGDGGTGLGLSQVYGFVERAHGTIKVDSKLGKGTLFNIYIPNVDDAVLAKVLIKPDEEQKSTHDVTGKSILVVDDEAALADLSAEILSDEGYQVIKANNASEALEAFKQNTFDLMLSDVIMPGMNGFELAEKVNTEYPNTKIIIVSGYNDKIRKTGVDYGFIDKHLDKPVSSARLIDVIKSTLE